MRRLLVPHLALWILGIAVIRVALVPAESCPPITAAGVHASAVAAADWLDVNLNEQGRFVYGYDRATDELAPGYNIVRHAGGTMSLYQFAALAGETRYLPAGDRAFGYLENEAFIRHGDWAAVATPDRSGTLGGTSLALAGLGLRRDATGDTDRDDLMRAMGRFLVNQQQPDGSILAYWDGRTQQPLPGVYDVFATGEAVWALAMLHRHFPGEGWDRPVVQTMAFMADGTRERLEGHIARQPDHWAAYALEEMGKGGLVTDDFADYARRLAGYFSFRLRLEAQRTGEGVNVAVRWFPGPPSGVGTAGEGMAALYRLANNDDRLADMLPDMGRRLTCMAGLMAERQISPQEAALDPRPELSEGAWYYRSYTQVDGQQHVLSALIGAELVAEEHR